MPATKPTDKTDITPYIKNIYTAKVKSRRRYDSTIDDETPLQTAPTRRESEDEAFRESMLELAAKEAERQIQATAMEAFPNSRFGEPAVAHFYFRESSGSEESPDEDADETLDEHGAQRARRKSSSLSLNWWHKHMQEHAQELAFERGEDDETEAIIDEDKDSIMVSDSELDKMDLALPPDTLWTTSSRASIDRRSSRAQPAGSLSTKSNTGQARQGTQSATRDVAHAPTGFGRPFGAFNIKPETPVPKKLSPPMLGKDLTFRTCPSPQMTKLEPTHLFVQHQNEMNGQNRDESGQGGLWHGYCFKNQTANCQCPPIPGERMMATPCAPGTPAEHDDLMSEEPASMFSSADSIESNSTVEHRSKNGESKGLHMLHGLDERLGKEKSRAERNEKIAQEFTDEFVTQVYNYLSLGYPATASAFDEELSKFGFISIADLRENDAKHIAKGHMLEMKLEDTPEPESDPRWRALKIYITEWASQHPDLDALQPFAWGVRERRGSWAI